NLIASALRRLRHRQTMREKIPILAHQIDETRHHIGLAAAAMKEPSARDRQNGCKSCAFSATLYLVMLPGWTWPGVLVGRIGAAGLYRLDLQPKSGKHWRRKQGNIADVTGS